MLANNPPPAEADPSSDPAWVDTELTREDIQANSEASYAGTAMGQELARSGGHAGQAGRLAVAKAKAAMQRAIDDAQADKQYKIDVFNEQGGPSGSSLNSWDASESR